MGIVQNKINAKAGLISRNVKVLDKRTSVRLEKQMWNALKDIADRESCTIHDLCSLVAINKESEISLTASIRIFIMMYFKAAATEEGHKRAKHGGFHHMLQRAKITSAPVRSKCESALKVQYSSKVESMRFLQQKIPNYA